MACSVCSSDKHSLRESALCDGIKNGWLRKDGSKTQKAIDREASKGTES